MRTIRFLLQKEFRQIFRNKTILALIIVMPAVQLTILPLAADYEIKNINIAVVDLDHSSFSQRLVSTITASGYFKLVDYNSSFQQSFKLIEKDQADLILEIPANFEKTVIREQGGKLFVAVNAINGVKAGIGAGYLSGIIGTFTERMLLEYIPPAGWNTSQPVIEIAATNWYNTHMNYRIFMVPGILAILVTMIGGFFSALNIVKEKEVGTIEQLNVTPIRKHHFILGKLIPFWILGNVAFTIGLLISWLVYGIVPQGSLLVFYLFITVYLLCVLGLGLLISTYTENQQQAMFVMFFFMMIFVLLGGLFTSIDSMPGWAQQVSRLNPARYLIEVMRMIVLKGSGFRDVLPHMLTVLTFAVIFNTWAVLNYKKTT